MAERPLDRMIALLFREQGEELRLATGKQVILRSPAGDRSVLATPLRNEQIEQLLEHVAPPSRGQEVVASYPTPRGEVTVSVRRGAGGIQVSVRRAGDEGGSTRSPAPPVDALMRAFVADPEVSHAPASAPASGAARPRSALAAVGIEPIEVQVLRGTPNRDAAGGAEVGVGRAAPAPAPVAPLVLANPARSEASPVTSAGGYEPRFGPPSPGTPAQIDAILHALVQHKASDLHLTTGLVPKMRLDGEITDVPGYAAMSSEEIERWLMEVAPGASQRQFQETHDADYAHEIPGLSRFRVNAFRDRRGVGGVLRVIPSRILSFEQLNLPPVCQSFCRLAKGLVVVTGPTGSGKSTTLAAMIDWINSNRKDHLITIEDPIEFVHPPKSCLINQREVHTHTRSFSAALRAALREDPDIVLVGEMRDLETVSIAIETAETGHLVFGTLHTNTAISTVDRIIDQFPTDQQAQVRVMLSESLKGVIAQTLCKKIGGGRVAALEILVVVPAVANVIREGKTFQMMSIMQTGRNLGMQLLNDAFMNLVKGGKVAPQEAYNRAVNKTELKTLLEGAGYRVEG